MIYVKQLLEQKEGPVISVGPQDTLRQAIQLMYTHDIGVVVVMQDEELKGIFSERDFTRGYCRDEGLDLNTPVSELMTDEVISVRPDQTIDECMALMTKNHIRHLPAFDQGKVIGIISIGDLVKELLAERDSTIRGLENYILGKDTSS